MMTRPESALARLLGVRPRGDARGLRDDPDERRVAGPRVHRRLTEGQACAGGVPGARRNDAARVRRPVDESAAVQGVIPVQSYSIPGFLGQRRHLRRDEGGCPDERRCRAGHDVALPGRRRLREPGGPDRHRRGRWLARRLSGRWDSASAASESRCRSRGATMTRASVRTRRSSTPPTEGWCWSGSVRSTSCIGRHPRAGAALRRRSRSMRCEGGADLGPVNTKRNPSAIMPKLMTPDEHHVELLEAERCVCSPGAPEESPRLVAALVHRPRSYSQGSIRS